MTKHDLVFEKILSFKLQDSLPANENNTSPLLYTPIKHFLLNTAEEQKKMSDIFEMTE